jgi:hypothetical protein
LGNSVATDTPSSTGSHDPWLTPRERFAKAWVALKRRLQRGMAELGPGYRWYRRWEPQGCVPLGIQLVGCCLLSTPDMVVAAVGTMAGALDRYDSDAHRVIPMSNRAGHLIWGSAWYLGGGILGVWEDTVALALRLRYSRRDAMWAHPVGRLPPPFVYGNEPPFPGDLPANSPDALALLRQVLEDAYAGTCRTFPARMQANQLTTAVWRGVEVDRRAVLVLGYTRVRSGGRSEAHVVVVSANQIRSAADEYHWGAVDSQRYSGLALPSPRQRTADVARAVDIVDRLLLVQDMYVLAIRGEAIRRTAGGPERYEGRLPRGTYLRGRRIRRIWKYLTDRGWKVQGDRVHRMGVPGGVPGLGTREDAEWALDGPCPEGVRVYKYIISGVPRSAR